MAKVPPETIDRLGREAVDLSMQAKISLNEAIAKVCSNFPELNFFHIQTICWEANNEYFRKTSAARSNADKDLVFSFPLADVKEVLKILNRGKEEEIERGEVGPLPSRKEELDYVV